MEYSSTKKVRLPGISTRFEEVTPVNCDADSGLPTPGKPLRMTQTDVSFGEPIMEKHELDEYGDVPSGEFV
jgi:hypothetical protein